jgi:hypothetical protein
MNLYKLSEGHGGWDVIRNAPYRAIAVGLKLAEAQALTSALNEQVRLLENATYEEHR